MQEQKFKKSYISYGAYFYIHSGILNCSLRIELRW